MFCGFFSRFTCVNIINSLWTLFFFFSNAKPRLLTFRTITHPFAFISYMNLPWESVFLPIKKKVKELKKEKNLLNQSLSLRFYFKQNFFFTTRKNSLLLVFHIWFSHKNSIHSKVFPIYAGGIDIDVNRIVMRIFKWTSISTKQRDQRFDLIFVSFFLVLI